MALIMGNQSAFTTASYSKLIEASDVGETSKWFQYLVAGQVETYANDWGGRTWPVICPPTEPVDMNNGICMDVAAS